MVIRRSSSAEVRLLIEALEAADDVSWESAIARLAVIGSRAIEQLLEDFSSASGRARAGMLRVFESSADPRTLTASRSALQDPSAVVQAAAIGAVRALLSSSRPDTARDALDALVAIALDHERMAPLRLAAIEALRELPPDVRRPLETKLASDPDPQISGRVDAPPPAGEHVWGDAVEGRLPAAPDALKRVLAAVKTRARLTE